MDKEEMLACFDKFDLIQDAIKTVDENIYMAITFTVNSFGGGFKSVSYTHLTLPTILRV